MAATANDTAYFCIAFGRDSTMVGAIFNSEFGGIAVTNDAAHVAVGSRRYIAEVAGMSHGI